ncbi:MULTISPECIES: Bug family tripartite tricarboxylate transporter substrate binding protein [Bradyrhizobium]|uniref:Tripartite tricarboxylate transporter substrate binding protein n=1 Tax=Bradyrhizobium arachidis TaxID=858423 RepID=A0AAE7TJ20_9BRAD|nr:MULTISPECIES: tripartite tricarboxylate transporter substrate binding protein [Bradyrhizobium]QOG21887.1 tripartite tricarboxylate transporter substrate binding protein [Bradyrhizobium sp. SEMIA]QOZ71002.1 tripartite tricarboxylate transporter substrate binding protein [Bradyrhizobium arachidis]SFV17750.1 Tripartite-type tricarboxylate transporter, receptor component TctC [Bradyrhizobium arachidis]
MRVRDAIVLCLITVSIAASGWRQAAAESYPSRRINLIVPFPAGSATDAVTRRLAESIRIETGATVLIENKPGADGNLAALAVLKAEADGYTVFVTTNSTQAANINLFNAMPYDPAADFAPVAGIMTIPMMLAVKPEFPAQSVAEFIAMAKTREKPLSFGSGNTSSRGAAELFRARAGINMQHVPYRGMPQALTDVLAGEIDCVFADPASAQGLIQDGRLRVLAVTSSDRLAGMPDVPTLAQAGLSGAELTAWVGVFVRTGTASDIVAKLSQVVLAFVNNKETADYLESVGAKPFPAGADRLKAFEEADTRRWAEIVAIAKIEKK